MKVILSIDCTDTVWDETTQMVSYKYLMECISGNSGLIKVTFYDSGLNTNTKISTTTYKGRNVVHLFDFDNYQSFMANQHWMDVRARVRRNLSVQQPKTLTEVISNLSDEVSEVNVNQSKLIDAQQTVAHDLSSQISVVDSNVLRSEAKIDDISINAGTLISETQTSVAALSYIQQQIDNGISLKPSALATLNSSLLDVLNAWRDNLYVVAERTVSDYTSDLMLHRDLDTFASKISEVEDKLNLIIQSYTDNNSKIDSLVSDYKDVLNIASKIVGVRTAADFADTVADVVNATTQIKTLGNQSNL